MNNLSIHIHYAIEKRNCKEAQEFGAPLGSTLFDFGKLPLEKWAKLFSQFKKRRFFYIWKMMRKK